MNDAEYAQLLVPIWESSKRKQVQEILYVKVYLHNLLFTSKKRRYDLIQKNFFLTVRLYDIIVSPELNITSAIFSNIHNLDYHLHKTKMQKFKLEHAVITSPKDYVSTSLLSILQFYQASTTGINSG